MDDYLLIALGLGFVSVLALAAWAILRYGSDERASTRSARFHLEERLAQLDAAPPARPKVRATTVPRGAMKRKRRKS